MQKIEDMEIAGETEEGIIKKIGESEEIETKFGLTHRVPITVDIRGSSVEIGVFIRDKSIERGMFHPRSNVYKLLAKYNCKKLKDLIGKKVQIRIDNRGFYRFVI
jgi:hypothetical protein